MKNEITIFENKTFGKVRTIFIKKNIWFVAKDVCDILGMSDVSMSVRNLDDDEKGTSKVCTLRGEQEMLIISESGLYTLIIRSNKPEAKQFRKWVTSEVLPSIRKTGSYESKPNLLLKRFQENRLRIKRGYFSIITESYNIFFQQFEAKGFELPLDFCPDISIGKMFCKWLRDTRNYNTGDLPKYNHHYPDGRVVEANMYPTDLWIPFLDYFIDIWLATHFLTYLNNKKTDESKQILDFVKSHSEMIDYSDSRKKISA